MKDLPTAKQDSTTNDLFIYGCQISPGFTEEIRKLSGENTLQCYQCGECTAGCPAAFSMEITPNKVMRLVQLGCEDSVLKSETIWLCAGCETCATRCPRGLSVAKVMDACREMATTKGVKSGESIVSTFHREFLAEIKRHGRIHEVGLLGRYKVLSRNLFSDIPLGIKMFLKGKLALLPTKIKGKAEVKKLFQKTAAK